MMKNKDKNKKNNILPYIFKALVPCHDLKPTLFFFLPYILHESKDSNSEWTGIACHPQLPQNR